MPKVGDVIEFHRSGYPPPPKEWIAERIEEIRVVEEYDDKEGHTVSQVSWRAIREYESLVVISGETVWGRNDQVRPISPPPREEHPAKVSKAFRAARRAIKQLGFRLEAIDDEYRVMETNDRPAHYAETLEDAVSIAQQLADVREKARAPLSLETRTNFETKVTHLSIEKGLLSFDVLVSPQELKQLAVQINDALKALGDVVG